MAWVATFMGSRLIVECLKSRNIVITPLVMVNTAASGAPNHINAIKELNDASVYIKDKASVNDIIDKIIKGGYEKLQVVLDYDKTITKQHIDGVPQPSSFGKSPGKFRRRFVAFQHFQEFWSNVPLRRKSSWRPRLR